MAKSRAASAKPVAAKDATQAKVNTTAARRSASKAQDAPVAQKAAAESDEPQDAAAAPKKLASHGSRTNGKTTAPATATKRKKDEESETEAANESAPAVKRPKVEPSQATSQAKPAKSAKPAAKVEQSVLKPLPKGPRRTKNGKVEINPIRYTEPLKVFVFGEGSSGELGLGATKKAIDVKRPRYNESLSNMNVVRIATGGMHVVALTKDNQILTWGVNDNGALGRDTSNANVKMRDVDANDSDSDSEDESGGLNDLESTPTAISNEHFPEDTVFVDVAAGDSCSFALTTEGAIYGWGTFRKNEGVLGFERGNRTAHLPVYIDGIKKATQIACGTNHVYALDADSRVYAWGNGQQNQLGRRVTERSLAEALHPNRLAFHDKSVKKHSKKIVSIASGDYHGLAIAEDGHIWAWGANNYCETGYPDNAGNDDASLLTPQIIHSLEGKNVKAVDGGSHHNIAITQDGQVFAWGRCDNSQTGIPSDLLAAEQDGTKVLKNNGKAKILVQPTQIPNLKDIVSGSCGPDHTIVMDKDGKAYAWGFSANYQTGLGTDVDVDVPTLIENTATREEKLTWAGCGGQFSILASKK